MFNNIATVGLFKWNTQCFTTRPPSLTVHQGPLSGRYSNWPCPERSPTQALQSVAANQPWSKSSGRGLHLVEIQREISLVDHALRGGLLTPWVELGRSKPICLRTRCVWFSCRISLRRPCTIPPIDTLQCICCLLVAKNCIRNNANLWMHYITLSITRRCFPKVVDMCNILEFFVLKGCQLRSRVIL